MFQSHLGSILPQEARDLVAVGAHVSIPPWFDFAPVEHVGRHIPAPEFQSHLGSILPRCLQRLRLRLGLLISIPPWFDFAAFAFIFHHTHIDISIPPWFDFALPQRRPAATTRNHFNPTLVRFCHHEERLRSYLWRNFNPTLVRFCQHSNACCSAPAADFNPTLVRFCPSGKSTAQSSFSLISIPPWFDFAKQQLVGWREVRQFQSHLGSILPQCGRLPTFPTLSISIPPWFDFAIGLERTPPRAAPFQSHLGSILPLHAGCRQRTHVPHFNPTLVRFCLPSLQGLPAAQAKISIPPWFDFAHRARVEVCRILSQFQSHLGSILPSTRCCRC